jgi:hypothetical protein
VPNAAVHAAADHEAQERQKREDESAVEPDEDGEEPEKEEQAGSLGRLYACMQASIAFLHV